MENKSVFNCFLNCVMLLLSRMFLGSLFHRVGPAQANARRPKRSRLTLGTSSSNPPAERSERGGVWRRSTAARYSGVPLYMALCTSTSSLKSIRFLTGSQCMWSPSLKPMHMRIVLVYTHINPVTKYLFLSFLAIANLALHLFFIVNHYLDRNVGRTRE